LRIKIFVSKERHFAKLSGFPLGGFAVHSARGPRWGPNQWFQARLAYSKTTSVWSMVGSVMASGFFSDPCFSTPILVSPSPPPRGPKKRSLAGPRGPARREHPLRRHAPGGGVAQWGAQPPVPSSPPCPRPIPGMRTAGGCPPRDRPLASAQSGYP